MKRASAVAAMAALAMLGLAACGGGSDNNNATTAAATPANTATAGGGGGGASTVNISTPSGSELAYEQKDASAKAGSVTIDFQNNESIPHDVAVEDSSGKQLGATDLVASGSSTTTVDLTPGTYTFFCTVPGHRDAGMEGTLTVK
ncbi:MAG TPA: plastocyanin/azurin family copper-binding protein [Solirubrobacterales bacterium]|nr:plastocyanin/azurin family copper-binding protein [Solirubrobacterales bacterium]